MKELNHLSEIFINYDTFVIDLWGVMHNGIKLNSKAVEVIDHLEKNSKKVVFLSNAPRPSSKVISFLIKMNMDKKFLKNVMTSGEAAMHAINQNKYGKSFFHLGPPRDISVFEKVKGDKTGIENCDFILCTGLFDEYENDLNYYETLLKNHINKKLICTNPDLTVHRGNIEELCAGTIAKIFEKLGGEVKYFGKPYPEVYEKAFNNLQGKKVICIGDNLNTDIKGANILNFDSLLINNGIHKNEISNGIKELIKKYNVNVNYTQTELKW